MTSGSSDPLLADFAMLKAWDDVRRRTKVLYALVAIVLGAGVMREFTRSGQIQGMLYASQASPVISSPPTHLLTRPATAVFAAHPARMIIVVNTGWISRMTRKPNPADMPPRTLRTIHSRSNLSSSRISRAPPKSVVLLRMPGSHPGACPWVEFENEGDAGSQIVRRNRRKSFVKEE